MITEYSFSDELTDLYRLNNDNVKADKNANEVISMLGPASGDENETDTATMPTKNLPTPI